MTLRKYISLFIILFSCNLLLSASDFKTSVYISAHQDDWQLFVGDYAYNDILDDGTETVFIYITAGDAGKDNTFWRSREEAALASVEFILNATQDSIERTEFFHSINSHSIKCYQLNNIKNYFFRLPDGYLSDLAEDSTLLTLDEKNSYLNYADFKNTLSDLLTSYTDTDLHIITHEPDEVYNPKSHPDHRVTGRTVTDIQQNVQSTILYYKDYTTQDLPANTDHHSTMQKSAEFLAYDKIMYDLNNYCTACESPLYTQWIFRTYISRIVDNQNNIFDIPVTPTTFTIQQNYPNPFNNSTIFTFSISAKSYVSFQIYNAAGELVDTFYNKVLKKNSYKFRWNAEGLSSGIYFFRLRVNNSSKVKKCTFLK